MPRKIEEVEGIGPAYALKLNAAGIRTDADLLERAGTPKGMAELSVRANIRASLLLKWVNHVDLMRVTGIGPQFAELLEAAGVDTVKELAQRNAANLAAKLIETNARRRLCRTNPSESQVADWIAQAADLDRKILY
ncbi:MAG: DUF4332 domain-containing protein [Bryobacterales bacterium]|nr:DUF4332 domain-containing protein [Bryobacterales bacterium]